MCFSNGHIHIGLTDSNADIFHLGSVVDSIDQPDDQSETQGQQHLHKDPVRRLPFRS